MARDVEGDGRLKWAAQISYGLVELLNKSMRNCAKVDLDSIC